MEERLNVASRWLVALTAVIVPLTVIVLISAPWGLNYQYDVGQWTKYMLFAAWILFALSLGAGVSVLVSPPAGESGGEQEAPADAVEGEPGEEGEEEKEKPAGPEAKPAFNFDYALLLSQATCFMLGMILYVVYLSWMILSLKPMSGLTGM